MTDEGTVTLQITPADVATAAQSDPLLATQAALHAEKLKNVALIRTLIEAKATIEELTTKRNGRSRASVPTKAQGE